MTVTKMPQSKAQKKFEKRHLKDVLERRNSQKKIKQRQQLKEKKKSRRAEEEGRDSEHGKCGTNGNARNRRAEEDEAFKNMSVDDFFQGGFEIPEIPKSIGKKRKRQEVEQSKYVGEDEDSDVLSDDEPVLRAIDGSDSDGSDEGEDLEGHREQLDALAANDPEFHKYLQENEPGLLGAELEGIHDLSDDEAEPEKKKARKGRQVDDDSDIAEDDEVPGGRKNDLSSATVAKWRTGLTNEHSLRAAREVVLAFRAAAHVSDDEEEEQFKYSISDPNVYHELLTLALTQVPEVFQHHLPVQEGKNGRVHIDTGNKKFKTLGPLLKSHITSTVHLLGHLSDASTIRLTLTSTIPLLPYMLSFKKLARNLTKAVTAVWSSPSNTEATRISAFLLLRRLTTISDAGIRENVLKAVYQSLVKSSRNTTIHTLAGMNLMKNSASELWGLVDSSVAYTAAFTAIRQLAIHLRTSIHKPSSPTEGYKAVYNWQYTHSLDFWSRVLSLNATSQTSNMHPLIYPLVQTTLGALRLIPTATYFPLRFHLVRSLLRLSRATNTFIPLAAPIYEVLASAEMRKPPKPSTLKPLDFNTSIRAPKGYLRTRVYQDGVGEQVQELLAEFLGLWSKSIAFPELSLPVVVMLKRWLKDVGKRGKGEGNKNQKVNGMIQLLVQKIESQARYVEGKRSKVEFAPNDRKGVESFLQETDWEATVLGSFVVGLRKVKEEREKVERRAREDEQRAREKDQGKGGNRHLADDVESEDDDEDMADGPEEEDEDGVFDDDEESE